MRTDELFSVLKLGEDSRHQFKKNVTNADALAAEFVAFSNSGDGEIFIGVNDDGSVYGLSPDDIRRLHQLFRASGLVYADESPSNIKISDIDTDYFRTFFERQTGKMMESQDLPLAKIAENMNLCQGDFLNVAGALIFGKTPSAFMPMFIVKAGCFPGTEITTDKYIDSRDICGKMENMFHDTVSFILANVRHVQAGQNVNSLGEPEIPRIAIEEIVANALVHRDYFVPAPVRVFVFDDRVEIISPGHLPNHLTVENVKSGNSNARNPVLASFANKILPYRGYGSGILRAIKAYPNIEFIDDRSGNLFKVVFSRNV